MHFNLLEQPWLPVRWVSGAPPAEVGLREALVRAHEIEELASDNPLETLALNRLLAALVAAVYPGAAEEAEWLRLWDAGRFGAADLDRYLAEKKLADRFDLLSRDYPFLGHLQPETAEVSPPTRLQHAATSGNNALLFSHDLDGEPRPLSPAAAARAVVCTQAAALGGGVAKPFNFSHGPLVGGAYFWVRGAVGGQASLQRALLLNLAPTPDVWGTSPHDVPTWETAGPVKPEMRQVAGIRELFTFQSRRLALVADARGQVLGVRYNQGSKVQKLLLPDPHLAYRAGKEGVFPLRFQAGRALWRDSTTYLLHRGGSQGSHAPRTLEWLSSPLNLRKLAAGPATAFAVDVFGLVNDQAKVELWRHERITLYPSILEDEDRWATLRNMLTDDPTVAGDNAARRASRLREATRAFAARARLNKPWNARLGDVERAERDAYAQALATDTPYWLALGAEFDYFLAQVASVPAEQLEQVLAAWQLKLADTAQRALRGVLTSLAVTARTWQALTEADAVLSYVPKPKTLKNQPISHE